MNTRDDNLLSRACRAWEQHQENANVIPQYPNGYSSVVSYDGSRYAVLVDIEGVLSVYRELGDGSLQRLREFPDQLLPLMGMAA
jgi:hypothetical protein